MEKLRIQCLAHSDRNKFKYGTVISIGKDVIIVKYDDNSSGNPGETIEYPKKYLGHELEILED